MKASRIVRTGLFIFIVSGAAVLGFSAWAPASFAREADTRRFSVVLFPTENNTDLQVWQSKYYPYSILEQKMTEYLAALFSDSPMTDVTILDENGMNRWLNQPRRAEDMALQMELYSAILKERQTVGTVETGSVKLRVKIFDAAAAEQFATRIAVGKDKRYTFDPGDDKLFWIDTMIVSLPVPFKDGLDVLGLAKAADRGQKMSRPTWQQFSGTSHWQSIKNAVKDGYHEAMSHISIALKRNDPERYDMGDPPFNPFAVNVGRIISPTANSKRRRREYVVSIGREDTLKVGDILEVVRSDTYITVDPENPAAVVPASIGKVKVLSVQERTAVVQVIQDNRKEPIQLQDLVMKFHRPEVLEMNWKTKKP
ncbi:MAG: hypothetical protein LBJ22_06710 [Synergistaceae bacterium]|jgi:hypothetical protein|nr:hypothetical protein [Synergistaceae bacterium]